LPNRFSTLFLMMVCSITSMLSTSGLSAQAVHKTGSQQNRGSTGDAHEASSRPGSRLRDRSPGSAHEQCSKRRCAQGDNFHQRVELQAMARAELGAVSGEAGGWCSRALSGAASSANGKETARQKKTQAVRSSGFF
jgi:hypothetical protein